MKKNSKVVTEVKEAAAEAKKAVEPAVAKAAEAVAEVKKAAPKTVAEAKKAAPKKAAEVVAEVKKAAPKKAPAKKPAKSANVKVVVQYADKEISCEQMMQAAKAAWTGAAMKDVAFYVKPEENRVYFVVNGEEAGSFEI